MSFVTGLILIGIFGWIGIWSGSVAIYIIDPSKPYPGETKHKLGAFKTLIVVILILVAIFSLVVVICGFGLLFGG